MLLHGDRERNVAPAENIPAIRDKATFSDCCSLYK